MDGPPWPGQCGSTPHDGVVQSTAPLLTGLDIPEPPPFSENQPLTHGFLATAQIMEPPLGVALRATRVPIRSDRGPAAINLPIIGTVPLRRHQAQRVRPVTLGEAALVTPERPTGAPVGPEITAAAQATMAQGIRPFWLYALDGRVCLLVQAVYPVATLDGAGLLRFGTVDPSQQHPVQWWGYAALPSDFAAHAGEPYLQLFASPDSWLVGLQSHATANSPDKPVDRSRRFWWGSIPYPVGWPYAATGELGPYALGELAALDPDPLPPGVAVPYRGQAGQLRHATGTVGGGRLSNLFAQRYTDA